MNYVVDPLKMMPDKRQSMMNDTTSYFFGTVYKFSTKILKFAKKSDVFHTRTIRTWIPPISQFYGTRHHQLRPLATHLR